MDFVKSCLSKCDSIKTWFEPFFWVLVCPLIAESHGCADVRMLSNGCGSTP